jgi:hypothetical protein
MTCKLEGDGNTVVLRLSGHVRLEHVDLLRRSARGVQITALVRANDTIGSTELIRLIEAPLAEIRDPRQ